MQPFMSLIRQHDHFFFETGSSLSCNLPRRQRRLVSKSQGYIQLCFFKTIITSLCHHAHLFFFNFTLATMALMQVLYQLNHYPSLRLGLRNKDFIKQCTQNFQVFTKMTIIICKNLCFPLIIYPDPNFPPSIPFDLQPTFPFRKQQESQGYKPAYIHMQRPSGSMIAFLVSLSPYEPYVEDFVDHVFLVFLTSLTPTNQSPSIPQDSQVPKEEPNGDF